VVNVAGIAGEDEGIVTIQGLHHDDGVYNVDRRGVAEEPARLPGDVDGEGDDLANLQEQADTLPLVLPATPSTLDLCVNCRRYNYWEPELAAS